MIQLAPGTPRELGYAEITSSVVQTGVGSTDVAGLSVTVTVGSRPILIIVSGSSIYCSAAGSVGGFTVKEGSTQLGAYSAVGTTIFPVVRILRLAPSAGSHTYKVNINQLVTGNTTLGGSATDPCSIQVLEV